MGRLLDIVTPLHRSTSRDYLGRMQDDKIHCMEVARRYDREFWDGERRYGYGGYRYDGRWKVVAERLIETYGLTADSSILDVGCGKGFLLFELAELLTGARIAGFDISEYAVANAKPEVREQLLVHRAEDPFPYADDEFDLVISLGALHNLAIEKLKTAVTEVARVGKSGYILVESFRSEAELFNLQCWALTCESFHRPESWRWLFDEWGYDGDYELIYFE